MQEGNSEESRSRKGGPAPPAGKPKGTRNATTVVLQGGNDQTVYLVVEDFGKLGRAWREADYEATDLETVIQNLLSGQYNNPIRVVAFNTDYRREMCHPPFKISLNGTKVPLGGN
jgi:hypothetical protein